MLWFRFREAVSVPRARSCKMRTERLIVALGIGAALLVTAVPLRGQEQPGTANRPTASRPWPPKTLSDGQPDVEGIWAATMAGSTSLTNPISGGEDFDRRVKGTEIRRP